ARGAPSSEGGDDEWVSFTYEDHVLATVADGVDAQRNQRNVGVAVPLGPVRVPASHPRNHDGQCFSVLVTRTVDQARPGSDEIERAYEDAWVGRDGYLRVDGGRQRRALAFLGDVRDERGGIVTELFVVDLPDDVTQRGADPLEGTLTRRPAPPAGTVQRRLTHTTERRYPGIQGVRHWPRSCADGSCIAFLMRDDQRHVQLWTIGPEGGQPQQITQHPFDVASAFSWSPAGDVIAYIADGSVFVTRVANQTSERLTMPIGRSVEADHELGTPRPEACVFAPDGKSIAYVRSVKTSDGVYNQVFVVQVALGE
ncbi:MAG: DUF3748 domain-containing protein, partial [Planctomycetales bacterium]|nr:DUF3748 domain-containing protein [Planctomycetales bacterium]